MRNSTCLCLWNGCTGKSACMKTGRKNGNEKTMTKGEIRKTCLKNRNLISEKQKKIWDREIFEALWKYEEAYPADIYLCYVSYQSEVSTLELIDLVSQIGKAIFVPKVLSITGEKDTAGKNQPVFQEMDFYRIDSRQDLTAGYQGISEPEGLEERRFCGKSARMLLPGAAFDRQGNRIGYGAGFYDRWLAKADCEIEKIGLCYTQQLVSGIPAEPQDIRVDKIVTQQGMLICKNGDV